MASPDHPTAAPARLLPPIAPPGPRDRLLTSELQREMNYQLAAPR
jgi:hypothetical protein